MQEKSYRPAIVVSPKWQALGGAMFVLALAAPMALVGFTGDVDTVGEPDQASTAGAVGDVTPVPGVSDKARLIAEISGALIEPGRGIGPLRLGAPYRLAQGNDADGPDGTSEFLLTADDWIVAVTTEGADHRIAALDLLARNCDELSVGMPTGAAVPSTGDAITLGTHLSRIDRRFVGEGDTGWVDVIRRDGLIIEFCPVTALVNQIRIEPANNSAPVAVSGAPTVLGGIDAAASDVALLRAPGGSQAASFQIADSLGTPGFLAAEIAVHPARPGATTPRAAPSAPIHWSMEGSRTGGKTADPDEATRLTPALARAILPSHVALPGSVEIQKHLNIENSLVLAPSQRRDVQFRLSLLGYKTGGVDGIFGEQSRQAILNAQEAWGQRATGYLRAETLAALKRRSQGKVAEWRARKRTKLVVASLAKPTISARMPTPKHRPDCRRGADGKITENQSLSCDWAILGESLSQLF